MDFSISNLSFNNQISYKDAYSYNKVDDVNSIDNVNSVSNFEVGNSSSATSTNKVKGSGPPPPPPSGNAGKARGGQSSRMGISSQLDEEDSEFLKDYNDIFSSFKELTMKINSNSSSSIFNTSSASDDNEDSIYDIIDSASDESVNKVDEDTLYDTLSNIVDTYNDALDLLDDNYDSGTAVKSTLEGLTSLNYSTNELASIGISFDNEGYMNLDEDSFSDNYENNYNALEKGITGRNGLFSTLDKQVNKALTTSSFALVNKNIMKSSKSGMTISDFMNSSDDDDYSNDFTEQLKLARLFSSYGSSNGSSFSGVGLLLNMQA